VINMFDVVIIGAGPAGTAAAFDLLSTGMTVLLLDKYDFPRKKACAGGITPKGYRLFRYDISSIVRRECRSVRINPGNRKSFVMEDNAPLCYMTKREDLDLLSLTRVIEKGGDFRVIKKINSIVETPFFVEIDTGSGCFRASYLIGADGANSQVRRLVSKKKINQKLFAIEADVEVSRPDQYQMEFDFSEFKKGYFWIFPKDDHVNIGIYSVDPTAKYQVQHLLAYAKKRRLPGRLKSIKGYPIGMGGFRYRPESHRILLAGDAAGMSERLFGEGIFFALKSGQLSAQSIIEAEVNSLSAGDIYGDKIKDIQMNLKLYDLCSRFFYRFPLFSLKAASFSIINKPFAKRFAKGRNLTEFFR